MIWLMLATLMVVFFVGFRILNSSARRASQILTQRLNIEPVYVESMLNQMGKTAGNEFIHYLLDNSESHVANAANVLTIYQTFVIDSSDESLDFWHAVLRKAWLPTELTHQHSRLALSFLRELELDSAELTAWLERYNARYADEPGLDSDPGSNVHYLKPAAPGNRLP